MEERRLVRFGRLDLESWCAIVLTRKEGPTAIANITNVLVCLNLFINQLIENTVETARIRERPLFGNKAKSDFRYTGV